MRVIVLAFLKQVRIWFIFCLLICGGATGTIWFFWIRNKRVSMSFDNPLMGIAAPVVLALAILFCSHYFFNKGLKIARREGRLHARLQRYRSQLLLRWLLQAAAVMAALFMVIFTRNIAPFFLAVALNFYLLMTFPSKSQTYQHLDLESLKE
ncbi:MAG: hypothetical protein FD123_2085 [Bacteroidetes bacterium]|nr:MAG: hypothetical protein FD123_2085 [Bacteroidota bacterium]